MTNSSQPRSPGARGPLQCLRGQKGLGATQPGGHPRGPLHGGAVHARARLARGDTWEGHKCTTISDPAAEGAADLVQRRFNPPALNVLWGADFTYVSTWSGWVYAAFVIDAYLAASSAGAPART